ncbi:MAG: hypothetical protein KF901_07565, partial [Myxococcales bacterium]|nr:hypothetical protein [Myxococcales bacterium]
SDSDSDSDPDSDSDSDSEHTGSPSSSRLRMPFGPFLALAALEWLFFGDVLTEWFLALFD